jgi:hypothetical protein
MTATPTAAEQESNPAASMIHGTPHEASSSIPMPSPARPSRTPPYAVFFPDPLQAPFIFVRHLQPGLMGMDYSIRALQFRPRRLSFS